MPSVLILVLIILALAFIGVPMYLSILAGSLYVLLSLGIPLTSICTGMYESLAKVGIMAIPFFMVGGEIMSRTSLGERLINLFAVIFRPFRSGLAVACMVANAVFGAISGSAPAATATFGKIIYEPLRDQYDDKTATGLITSAGALSAIIPPSVVMILFATIAEVPIDKLFLCGIVPGILIVVIISIYMSVKTRLQGKGVKQKMPSLRELWVAFKRSIPVLLMPIIVLGGIYGGAFTPTEAGAFCAVYALVVGVFILKDIKPRELGKIMKTAGTTTGQVFIILAAGTVFSQAVTYAGYDHALKVLFSGLSRVEFLLILNVVLLLIGCFFDGGSAMLVIAPLIVPICEVMGINLLHAGIIITINLTIGVFTPPFGLNIFVAQGVMGKPMGFIGKSVVPYLICYVAALMIITFVPELSLFLVK